MYWSFISNACVCSAAELVSHFLGLALCFIPVQLEPCFSLWKRNVDETTTCRSLELTFFVFKLPLTLPPERKALSSSGHLLHLKVWQRWAPSDYVRIRSLSKTRTYCCFWRKEFGLMLCLLDAKESNTTEKMVWRVWSELPPYWALTVAQHKATGKQASELRLPN